MTEIAPTLTFLPCLEPVLGFNQSLLESFELVMLTSRLLTARARKDLFQPSQLGPAGNHTPTSRASRKFREAALICDRKYRHIVMFRNSSLIFVT